MAASLPLVIWARDNIVSLVRVQGPSMEPTLRQGDVVCVRKADGGLLPRLVKSLIFGDEQEEQTEQVMMAGGSSPSTEPSFARLYDRPPAVQRGQIIVLKSVDTAFPDEWHAKRVWGIPGTWVQVENGRIVQPNHGNEGAGGGGGERQLYRKLQGVPTHTVYVGGDNEDCSRDSRQYGPVSQNLIVGVAEYILWPPRRMQKIRSSTSPSRSVPLKKWEDTDDGDDDKEQA